MNFKIFSRLLNLPYKFFDTRNKSSIIYSLNSVLTIKDAFTDNIIKGLIDVGSLVFILIYIFFNSWILVIVTISLLFVNMFVIIFARRMTVDSSEELIVEEGIVQGIQNEVIQSILEVKMSALESNFLCTWEEKLDKYLSKFLSREKLNSSINLIFAFLQSISPAILLYISILLMIQGSMPLGKVLTTYSLSASLFTTINSLSSIWIRYQNCKLILEGLNDITSCPIEKVSKDVVKHEVMGDI